MKSSSENENDNLTFDNMTTINETITTSPVMVSFITGSFNAYPEKDATMTGSSNAYPEKDAMMTGSSNEYSVKDAVRKERTSCMQGVQ